MTKRYRKLKAIKMDKYKRMPKVRKHIPPPTKPHSPPKGKRGYDRLRERALFRREVAKFTK